MNQKQTGEPPSETRKSHMELQNRYGRIALSAVAAALSCGKDSKAPVETKPETRN